MNANFARSAQLFTPAGAIPGLLFQRELVDVNVATVAGRSASLAYGLDLPVTVVIDGEKAWTDEPNGFRTYHRDF